MIELDPMNYGHIYKNLWGICKLLTLILFDFWLHGPLSRNTKKFYFQLSRIFFYYGTADMIQIIHVFVARLNDVRI